MRKAALIAVGAALAFSGSAAAQQRQPALTPLLSLKATHHHGYRNVSDVSCQFKGGIAFCCWPDPVYVGLIVDCSAKPFPVAEPPPVWSDIRSPRST